MRVCIHTNIAFHITTCCYPRSPVARRHVTHTAHVTSRITDRIEHVRHIVAVLVLAFVQAITRIAQHSLAHTTMTHKSNQIIHSVDSRRVCERSGAARTATVEAVTSVNTVASVLRATAT
jgi:histidine ammonia-lyase